MWLILAFIAVPLIEIALFVVIGGAIGLWPTLIWVVLSAVFGILTLRWVARLGPISFARDVRALSDPASPVASRALTILAGVLLILPGFFTDAIGILLLVRPIQDAVIRFFAGRLRAAEAGQAQVTIDGVWTDATPPARTGPAVSDPASGPPPAGPTRH
jgi:UPF0716 protein FxsA